MTDMRKFLIITVATAVVLAACGDDGGGSRFDRSAAVELFNRSHPIDAVGDALKKQLEQRRDDLVDQAKTWCDGGLSSVKAVVTDTRTDNSLGEVSVLVHAGCPAVWDEAVKLLDA